MCPRSTRRFRVYLIFQRYKSKSKSQLVNTLFVYTVRCIWYFKDTNLKANHNVNVKGVELELVYLIFQRYKSKSKSQLKLYSSKGFVWCIWYFKDTNLKANHNPVFICKITVWVYLIFQRYKSKSKSQPSSLVRVSSNWCIWYFKDTNLKANHNLRP